MVRERIPSRVQEQSTPSPIREMKPPDTSKVMADIDKALSMVEEKQARWTYRFIKERTGECKC